MKNTKKSKTILLALIAICMVLLLTNVVMVALLLGEVRERKSAESRYSLAMREKQKAQSKVDELELDVQKAQSKLADTQEDLKTAEKEARTAIQRAAEAEQSNLENEKKSEKSDDADDADAGNQSKEKKKDRKASSSGGHIVVIDPGHQSHANTAQEPIGPGASETKYKVTGGTRGTTTGVYEYELVLDIGKKLKSELEGRGYTVYMTRESHDVDISNKERAAYATSVGGEISVRLHANGAESSSAHGACALVPSSNNPYVANLASASQKLGKCILDSYCSATGMANQGVQGSDNMSGINWSTIPVMIIEMGYMTNPSDDTNMEDVGYQEKMVQGIADGIDAYF